MALTDTGKGLVWGGKLWAEPHEVETLKGLKVKIKVYNITYISH